MALSPIQLAMDVCNKKSMSLADTNDYEDLNLGRFMFNKWLSMTSVDNALMANEMLNFLYEKEDKELMYYWATKIMKPFKGKLMYLKKGKGCNERAEHEDDLDVSNNERKLYDEFIKDLKYGN